MITNFPALLQKHGQEIARALPKHLTPERIIRVALTAFRLQPKLSKCDPRSIFAAVIQAAQLGLEVGGPMAEAHLIPFKTECQLVLGYQGLIKLARNTGQIADIYACEVRERDEFSITLGLHRDLHHAPLMAMTGFMASDDERGTVTGFYAVAVFKDGATTFTAMSRPDVEAVRNSSAGYRAKAADSPWTMNFAAMGCKTVIRRLCKFLPKSPELATALALESRADQGTEQKITLEGAIQGEYTEAEYDEEPANTPPPAPSDDPIALALLDLITSAATLQELEALKPDVAAIKGGGREAVKTAYKARIALLQTAAETPPAPNPPIGDDYLSEGIPPGPDVPGNDRRDGAIAHSFNPVLLD